MQLLARIKNIGDWKSVLDVSSKFFNESVFTCNNNSIIHRSVDRSNIALLEARFPSSTFEILKSDDCTFKVLTSDIKLMLSAASDGDIVDFELSDDKNLQVSVNNTLVGKLKVKTIEKVETLSSPIIDYTSRFHLKTNMMIKILSNFKSKSDFITINCNNDLIEFSSYEEENIINIEKNHPLVYEIEVLENTSSMYNLEYMINVIRSIGKSCKMLKMEYATSSPMRMSFKMPSNAAIDYYLAPRVVF